MPHDPTELLPGFIDSACSLQDVPGHVPEAKLERAGDIVSSRKRSQQAEGLTESLQVHQRRRGDHRCLDPRLLRDPCSHRLAGWFEGFLRRAEGSMGVRDQVVLIETPGDPAVRLELPKRVAIPFRPVQGDPEHLTDSAGTGRQRLRLLGCPHRGGIAASLQEADRAFECTLGVVGSSREGNGTDLFDERTRSNGGGAP